MKKITTHPIIPPNSQAFSYESYVRTSTFSKLPQYTFPNYPKNLGVGETMSVF